MPLAFVHLRRIAYHRCGRNFVFKFPFWYRFEHLTSSLTAPRCVPKYWPTSNSNLTYLTACSCRICIPLTFNSLRASRLTTQQSPPLSETWSVFTYVKVYNALLIILSLDQGAIAYMPVRCLCQIDIQYRESSQGWRRCWVYQPVHWPSLDDSVCDSVFIASISRTDEKLSASWSFSWEVIYRNTSLPRIRPHFFLEYSFHSSLDSAKLVQRSFSWRVLPPIRCSRGMGCGELQTFFLLPGRPLILTWIILDSHSVGRDVASRFPCDFPRCCVSAWKCKSLPSHRSAALPLMGSLK